MPEPGRQQQREPLAAFAWVSTEKSRRTKPPNRWASIPNNKIHRAVKREDCLAVFSTGSQSRKISKSKRDEAGCSETQWLLQDRRRISQRASQKADQHDRRKPQHRRVEKPFLRRLRH